MEWIIQDPKNYQMIQENRNVGSLLAKVLSLNSDESLEKQMPLNDFSLFHDSQKVLNRIEKAIANNEKIVIYGDYDCDGIMATSILVRAFELRKVQVGYHIPDRFVDGYGLNVKRVEEMAKKGYHLIITVDNGVMAHDAIDKANQLGMDVIVTDHHDLPDKLPKAYAIIHTQLSEHYPFKPISGGFVACKLATALLGKQDPYIYCMAALSTVSDMMPMKNENRTLVKKACEVMQKERYMSFELLLGENQDYNVTSLGFQLAPKINSIGRLVDGLNPNKCVTYFRHSGANSERERDFKLQFATSAHKLNQLRQKMTNTQYEIAKKNMQEIGGALVSTSIDYHEGLVGLIAGRMMNQYYRPTFVANYDSNTEIYKGSARSVPGLDLHDALTSLQDYLLVFGGHERAGGFSVEKGKWSTFLLGLEAYMNDHLTEALMVEKQYAIEISQEDISLANVKELSILQPHGMENEEPTFYLRLNKPSRVETLSNGKHLKMIFELDKAQLQVLYFNHGDAYENVNALNDLELFGQLSINKFRNFENIQMILKDIR